MAYFYFDFRDIDKKARRNLLPSFLTQLSSGFNSFCDILSRLYKAYDNGGRQPSDSALTRCLKEMLAFPHQRPVYLIMDALDECPDTSDFPSARAQVLDLVKDIVGLRLPNLRICVTSRPEVDITDALEPLASHAVSLQDEEGQKKDIADYVRSVVHSGPGKFMRRWRQEDKEQLSSTLLAPRSRHANKYQYSTHTPHVKYHYTRSMLSSFTSYTQTHGTYTTPHSPHLPRHFRTMYHTYSP